MLPRRSRILSAFIVCALTYAVPAPAQDSGERAPGKVVSYAEADNVHELYVGIMGEVDTPGTFRLGSKSLKLHRVIQCAHGFTRDASKAIRLVRMGRVRQTEIFSESADSPLLPGDLLIVESKRLTTLPRNSSDPSTRDAQTIRANYHEGTIRSGIQIALLNVLDYPLVLRLRPDQANAAYLVQALGQPISLLATTRVITPDVPRRQTSDAAKRAAQMEDGSVIVFEPGKVKRNRLPVTLPNPLDTDLLLGSQPGLMTTRIRNSHELRNLGHHPFWSCPDPFDSRSEIRDDRSASILPLDELPNVIGDGSEMDSSVVTTEKEFVSNPPEQSSAAEQEDSTESTDSLPVSDDEGLAPTSDDPAAIVRLDDGDSSAVESVTVGSGTIDSARSVILHILFLLLILVAGSLAAAYLFVRESRKVTLPGASLETTLAIESPSTRDASPDIETPRTDAGETGVARSLLGLLVTNPSLIRKEQITFSEGFDVDGRMNATVTSELLEMDLNLANATLPFEPSNTVTTPNVSPDDFSDETMSIPIRQHPDFSPKRPGGALIVRHETTDQEGQSAPTPLARALLQLEQRRSA